MHAAAALLDERVVMSRVGGACVNQHPNQLVDVALSLLVLANVAARAGHTELVQLRVGVGVGVGVGVSVGGTIACLPVVFSLRRALLRLEPLDGVRPHVDRRREFAVVIYLHLLHQVVIELEALQVQDKHRRQRVDAAALDRLDVLLRVIALILVVAVKHLALDELREPVQDRVLRLDLDRDHVEVLDPLGELAAVFAHNLVDQSTAKEALHQHGLRPASQRVLELVEKVCQELVHVHLDGRIHRHVLKVAVRRAEILSIKGALLRLLQ
eukprot:3418623-Pleurochrysis_carterae.AAC.1